MQLSSKFRAVPLIKDETKPGNDSIAPQIGMQKRTSLQLPSILYCRGAIKVRKHRRVHFLFLLCLEYQKTQRLMDLAQQRWLTSARQGLLIVWLSPSHAASPEWSELTF